MLGFGAQASLALAQLPALPASPNVTIAGVAATGSAGSVVPSVAGPASGVAATGAAGTVAPAVTITVAGVAGASAAGGATPNPSVAVTGVAATGSAGSVARSLSVAPAGVSATGAAGGAIAAPAVAIAGVAAAGAVGQAKPQPSGVPPGVAATGFAGAVGITITGGGTSRRRTDPQFGYERPRKKTRAVEPERKPPTFEDFLKSWTPPPFVVVDDLVRRPVVPAARPLPPVEVRYPHGLTRIAAQLDDAEDMQAIDAALDALPDERIDMLQLLSRLVKQDT